MHLISFLETRTAGDPDQPEFASTEFSPTQIAATASDWGTPVSPHVVRDWLTMVGLALHKQAKVVEGGSTPDRNAQFERITDLKREYNHAGNPVLSIDTKAKERLGQFYRKGRVWTQQASRAFDHDSPVGPRESLSLMGSMIKFGVVDTSMWD